MAPAWLLLYGVGDFPLFTLIRHIVFRPIGLDPARSRCLTIARRSTSRGPMTTIPAADDA